MQDLRGRVSPSRRGLGFHRRWAFALSGVRVLWETARGSRLFSGTGMVMTVSSDLHVSSLLGMSLKKEADETLFLELALRGYDLSRPRDESTTAEIIKI